MFDNFWFENNVFFGCALQYLVSMSVVIKAKQSRSFKTKSPQEPNESRASTHWGFGGMVPCL